MSRKGDCWDNALVPRSEFDNIWAYMTFHQNYKPLTNERLPEKMELKLLHLKHIMCNFRRYMEGIINLKA